MKSSIETDKINIEKSYFEKKSCILLFSIKDIKAYMCIKIVTVEVWQITGNKNLNIDVWDFKGTFLLEGINNCLCLDIFHLDCRHASKSSLLS